MKTLVPNRFLLDLEFELHYRKRLPRIDGLLRDWSEEDLLPSLGAIDGTKDFAKVWACWNETGLCIACEVKGRERPLVCDPARYWESDNLRLCTDMRDARSNKRATRFCQQFYFLPTGGGPKGRHPVAGTGSLQRAREEPPKVDGTRIQIGSLVERGGYKLEAHIPAECLSGFDPQEHPRIGFYYIVEDRELGQQYLTIGDDLLWYADPSTWATAVLRR